MDSQEYWENRYRSGGNSGYGSYGDQLARKLAWLKNLEGIKTISEIGCGDMNFGSNLLKIYPKAKYVGSDISRGIVTQNQGRYPEHIFTTENSEVPPADLVLCIDVLFHVLDDRELAELYKLLDKKWTKYLAITAYERDEYMEGHVRIRRFNPRMFGIPVIREVVEADGQLYFYLFKRPDIKPSETSCCLITKDSKYPPEILGFLSQQGFGEILILTNCDSPYRKHELFQKAKYENIYYQDDDAMCPVEELFQNAQVGKINVAMKEGHFEAYKDKKMTMGLGWGAIFPKSLLSVLDKYTDKFGKDEVFMRETERIFTHLNYDKQNRLVLPIVDLPSAWADDRLWRQPNHNNSAMIAEERCESL